MKNVITVFIIFLVHSISYGQWINQVSGTTENLNAVQFVDSNIGYVVGNNGTILKTSDSGSNWTALKSNITDHLKSLSFIDRDTGFVSGNYYDPVSNSRKGVLLKTTNAGGNWINLNFPYEESILDIFFINSKIGFASCGSEGLLRTSDGGANWVKVSLAKTKTTTFPSELIGFALMGGGIGKSIDGGITWSIIKDDSSPDYNGANILESIFFISETKGFFGSEYYGGIYSTSDGGSTLEYVHSPTFSIHFPSENIGYAITSLDGSTISKTTNAGNSWNIIHQNTSSFYDIFFIDNTKGWAVGEKGQIIYNNVVLGIENQVDQLKDHMIIFPNPASSVVNIEIHENIKFNKLSLYNIFGGLICEYDSYQKTISISRLPQGTYFLKLETDKGIISKKIVKP